VGTGFVEASDDRDATGRIERPAASAYSGNELITIIDARDLAAVEDPSHAR
jgi:hypothetical protein